MKILLKKLRPDAVIPSRGSEYAAGYDLSDPYGENENPKALVKMIGKGKNQGNNNCI